MEILQDPVPPAQHEAASDLSVSLDQNEVDQQILRREETETRLAVLDDLIGAQRSRIASARTTGLDVTFLEEKLKVLTDSREEYRSALKRLLADFADGKDGNGRVP